MNREFNLLDEPWIKVMSLEGEVKTVSLSEALINAHDYLELAGALPTLNVAILRQMLALLFSALANVDENGTPDPIRNKQQAFDRWQSLWEKRRFPKQILEDYFHAWHDRFWLFDDDRPFGQVKEAKIGTSYTAAKLNGEISESSNKAKLFALCAGSAKTEMPYAEAANWLIYVCGFDDTSAKPKGKNLPSVGAGWLGKIGLIEAVGNNLFESLLLNLTLLQNGQELWEDGRPAWELDRPHTAERAEIAMPQNLSSLYTLQSRRLLLTRSDRETVNGFNLLGGDFFPKENSFSEQMTVWRRVEGKKGQPDTFTPRRHNASRQFWRDLGTIVSAEANDPQQMKPGVVTWVSELQQRRIIERNKIIKFRISSVQYGDKDFFVTDVFGDTLAFHSALLENSGKEARICALDMIGLCESVAYEYGRLAFDLYLAGGGDAGDKGRKSSEIESAKEQFYYALDEPFRVWLEQLDPSDPDIMDEQTEAWKEQLQKTARQLGRELVNSCGDKAFTGRYVSEGTGEKAARKHYCAPEAYNWFLFRLAKVMKGR